MFMKSPVFVAFDFDGTLYPISPYDSEQLLMLKRSRKKGWLSYLKAKYAVFLDQRGMSWEKFTALYEHIIKGTSKELFSEVALELYNLCNTTDFSVFRKLKDAGVYLGIISCGTEELCDAFLKAAGIRDCFDSIRAKSVVFDASNNVTTLHVNVAGAQDKVRILREEIDRITRETGIKPLTFACGDGPTDMPMLAAADNGILVTWGKQLAECHHIQKQTPEEVCLHILNSL